MRNRIEVFGNYALVPDHGRFNAIIVTGRTSTIESTGDVIEQNETLGYGFTFDRAILRVVDDIIAKKIQGGKVETLKEYLIEYKKLKEEIKEMLT